MMVDRQFSNSLNERRGIASCVRPFLRQLDQQGLGCATLPPDVQSDDPWLRSLFHSDVAYQQTHNSLAIARCGGRRGPQTREVTPQLKNLTLLFGGYSPHNLSLEGREFGFEILQALRCFVPALFKRRGDQPVVGIDRLVAPFGEIDVIAGAFNPHPPLCANLAIALFQIGQGRERDLDRYRSDGADQPVGNGLIERNGGYSQTGTRRHSLPMLPEALVHRINAAVSPIAYGQPAAAIPAQKYALQQAKAFSGGTGQALVVGAIGAEPTSVGDEPVPVDIAFVMIVDHHAPSLLRHGVRPGGDIAGRADL